MVGEVESVLSTLGTVVDYAPGALIYMEMEPSRSIFILLEGEVRIYRFDGKGNEITLPYPADGDLLGELPVDEGDRPRYKESCEAQTASRLLRIDANRLCRHAHTDIAVANLLIAALSRRSRALTSYTCITAASTLIEKVARLIYEHETLFVSSPLTRIAGMLNTPPESLSRTLKKLRHDGMLVKEGQHYRVVEREALREYFDFAYYGG